MDLRWAAGERVEPSIHGRQQSERRSWEKCVRSREVYRLRGFWVSMWDFLELSLSHTQPVVQAERFKMLKPFTIISRFQNGHALSTETTKISDTRNRVSLARGNWLIYIDIEYLWFFVWFNKITTMKNRINIWIFKSWNNTTKTDAKPTMNINSKFRCKMKSYVFMKF